MLPYSRKTPTDAMTEPCGSWRAFVPIAAILALELLIAAACTPPGDPGPPLLSGVVNDICFSPKGDFFAAGGGGDAAKRHNLVRVWNAKNRQECARSSSLAVAVQSVEYSPDGKMLAWAAKGGYVVCRIEGRPQFLLSHDSIDAKVPAYTVCFTPNGKALALGGYYREVVVIDIQSAKLLRRLTGHNDTVMALAFNPVTGVLASGAGPLAIMHELDSEIRLWNVEQEKCLAVVDAQQEKITDLAFSPDGRYLVSASRDGTAKLWDGKTGEKLRTVMRDTRNLFCCEFSPDGKTLAIGGMRYHSPYFFNTDSWERMELLTDEKGLVTALAYSPDGNTIVTGGIEKLNVWDIKTGTRKEIDLIIDESEDALPAGVAILPIAPPEPTSPTAPEPEQ